MSSPEEVMEVIDEGKANRHVAVTSKYTRICKYLHFLQIWFILIVYNLHHLLLIAANMLLYNMY